MKKLHESIDLSQNLQDPIETNNFIMKRSASMLKFTEKGQYDISFRQSLSDVQNTNLT